MKTALLMTTSQHSVCSDVIATSYDLKTVPSFPHNIKSQIYAVPNRFNLHINPNAHEPLLKKLKGQNLYTITLMSLYALTLMSRSFAVPIKLIMQEVSKTRRKKGSRACQSQWPSRLVVLMNSSQLVSAVVRNQLIFLDSYAGLRK